MLRRWMCRSLRRASWRLASAWRNGTGLAADSSPNEIAASYVQQNTPGFPTAPRGRLMKALEGIQRPGSDPCVGGAVLHLPPPAPGRRRGENRAARVGDDFRDFARPPGWDVGPSFIAVNGGKRSVTVDLKSRTVRRSSRRLAARADVVVENQRPGRPGTTGAGLGPASAETIPS